LKNKILFFARFMTILILPLFLFSPNLYAQESSTCLECHSEKAASLLNTPHELRPGSAESSSLIVGCFSCHDGWQEHINDPTAENIQRPDELMILKQGEVCGRCHLTEHQSAMVTTDPHSKVGLECTSCHSVHGNRNEFLVKEDLDNFCVSCHGATAAEFNQRSAHPVESGNVRCVDCHDLSTIKNREFDIGFDWKCQSCHEEKAGPFLYEHPVTYDYLVNGESCTECHEPHGSVNDKLLKESGRVLCLQCHSLPPRHATMHSGLGSKYDCVECHSEIHGSFSNDDFLDPDLGDKLFPDCYQSGCHSVGN
jgi:DmsE family decaheme c-type cytochrome